ncbi:MAG: trans-aconitate 2-methyltransferase [Vicinamibacterales bacterium]
MSVATHLGITPHEYDTQILTFIPYYNEILDNAAAALDAVDRPARTLVDLGTGSGALAARCLARLKGAKVIGIDSDPGMLSMAAERLGRRLSTRIADFEAAPLPACDIVTASFSLHHIATPAAKRRLFAKVYRALRPGGLLVIADCATASSPRLQEKDMAAWHAHLASTHGRGAASRHLKAWGGEDTYFPLEDETAWLRRAGFRVDVPWRRGPFAVIAAGRPRRFWTRRPRR